MTYKINPKNMCNQWHTLPSEVTAVQMSTAAVTPSFLIYFVPTVVWSRLSSGPGSTIHKYQVAAFSSIFVVVLTKSTPLHYLAQPP